MIRMLNWVIYAFLVGIGVGTLLWILKQITTRECPHCRERIDKRASACPKCGRDVEPILRTTNTLQNELGQTTDKDTIATADSIPEHGIVDRSLGISAGGRAMQKLDWERYCHNCTQYEFKYLTCSAVHSPIKSKIAFVKYCNGQKFIPLVGDDRPEV